MTATREDGRAALERFLALYEIAEARGDELIARYRAEGNEDAAASTEKQVDWLRRGRDLVLEGRLLPGGAAPFTARRMFADFGRHSDGGVFERAAGALEDYWHEERLGLLDWDWQAGLPPGWAELAAEVCR